MIKEYIEKSIETESGFSATCWVVTGIWLDIKASKGVITLEGYKDFEAKEAGKQVMGTMNITIPDLNEMACYELVRENIIHAVFISEEFADAELKSVKVGA